MIILTSSSPKIKEATEELEKAISMKKTSDEILRILMALYNIYVEEFKAYLERQGYIFNFLGIGSLKVRIVRESNRHKTFFLKNQEHFVLPVIRLRSDAYTVDEDGRQESHCTCQIVIPDFLIPYLPVTVDTAIVYCQIGKQEERDLSVPYEAQSCLKCAREQWKQHIDALSAEISKIQARIAETVMRAALAIWSHIRCGLQFMQTRKRVMNNLVVL